MDILPQYAYNAKLLIKMLSPIQSRLLKQLLTAIRACYQFLKHRQFHFHIKEVDPEYFTIWVLSSHTLLFKVVHWNAHTETLAKQLYLELQFKLHHKHHLGKLIFKTTCYLGINKKFAWNALLTMLLQSYLSLTNWRFSRISS